MARKVTKWMDRRIPVEVDKEEFEIIKMMVKERNIHHDFSMANGLVKELKKQGISLSQASKMVTLARGELLEEEA